MAAGVPKARCENPTQAAAWEDPFSVPEEWYYECPVRFIPGNVFDFYEQYEYEKETRTALPYWQRSVRWMAAVNQYQHWKTHYSNELAKKPPKPAKGL